MVKSKFFIGQAGKLLFYFLSFCAFIDQFSYFYY